MMIKITNKTGYLLALPNGEYLNENDAIYFKQLKDIPETEDITICFYQGELKEFVYMTEYQRDSFGDIMTEYRLSDYLF